MTHGSVLTADAVSVDYPITPDWPWQRAGRLRAVHKASLSLTAGETLGLVGESGCGKSSLARALTGLAPVTGGQVRLDGHTMRFDRRAATRALRRDVQMIFQDPLASLDPRMTIAQIVAEPLAILRPEIDKAERRRRVIAMLERVGLTQAQMGRYPHEFSGGQCQRVGIARALVVEPRVLICDEPVSALDVSIQARILDLLAELQREMDIAILFIAHDLAVVRQISDRVRVMYLGAPMEEAPAKALFDAPKHPYTKALLSAVPRPDLAAERARRRIRLHGELPSAADPPSGCVFRTRCPWAQADCGARVPDWRALGGSRVACHHAEAIAAGTLDRSA